MTGCTSEFLCGLQRAAVVNWQGTMMFWADSDHLQRLMCSWATETVVLNPGLHII